MSNIKERIVQLTVALGVSQRAFGKNVGMSAAWVGTMSDRSIGSDVLAKILAKYPEVNVRWLVTGEGETFILETEDANDNETSGVVFYKNLYASVLRDNSTLRIENEKLRQDIYSSIDKYKKLTNEYILLKEKSIKSSQNTDK
jgi:hypothetical protein